jgi:hypothetical protein
VHFTGIPFEKYTGSLEEPMLNVFPAVSLNFKAFSITPVQSVKVKLIRLPFFKVIRLSSKPSTNKPFASSKPNNCSPDL